jgi:hypothetical protein
MAVGTSVTCEVKRVAVHLECADGMKQRERERDVLVYGT